MYHGEVVGSDYHHRKNRYLVKISETSEANLSTAIDNIQIGIYKANTWQTITAWTRPSKWCHIEFFGSNQAHENFKTNPKRWEQDIYLDVTWSTE